MEIILGIIAGICFVGSIFVAEWWMDRQELKRYLKDNIAY